MGKTEGLLGARYELLGAKEEVLGKDIIREDQAKIRIILKLYDFKRIIRVFVAEKRCAEGSPALR